MDDRKQQSKIEKGSFIFGFFLQMLALYQAWIFVETGQVIWFSKYGPKYYILISFKTDPFAVLYMMVLSFAAGVFGVALLIWRVEYLSSKLKGLFHRT